MSAISLKSLRLALLGATSAAALVAVPAVAAPDNMTLSSDIVFRDNLNPSADADGGIDGSDINGIGEMTVDEGNGYVGLCTGTLINPRTVIFAAHCVNDADASDYGTKYNGIPISFGFHSDNLPAILDWLGYGSDPTQLYKTNIGNALYNVEQVWYDKRSTALGPGLNFLQGDIAIATLDTPATNIPTWALLFSPLTAPAHAHITGYGDYGNGTVGAVDLDFRRRAAANVVSVLASLDDVDKILFGQTDGLQQSLYQLDFNDPKYGTAQANPDDFDIFGDSATAREGLTAPGDSGGPLIIDSQFARQVVAGVLSGGSTYFDGQAQSSYGTTSFYQPLFLYWDEIVANNPYRYATNLKGSAEWTDPSHWVQSMDPNYEVIRGGQLYNGLPSDAGQRTSSKTVKFGQACDGTTCTKITGGAAPAEGTGPGLVVTRGPGSVNFVPNNVIANPAKGVQAHYYDVTLAASGVTSLSYAVTIDRLTIQGPTELNINGAGKLKVLGDFNQVTGWTNVDGTLGAGESLMINGLLTGRGTFDPTYFTNIQGVIAPGSLGLADTLKINGDVILSSESRMYFDLTGTRGDKLAVQADADNPGRIIVDGAAMFTQGTGTVRSGDATPVRYGQVFPVVTAAGGVTGTFNDVVSSLPGVLYVDVAYKSSEVDAVIKASSLQTMAKSSGDASSAALKFAAALDTLRDNNYTNLANVFGSVDIMSAKQLAASLRGLAPATSARARTALDRQRITGVNLVADRLSQLGGAHPATGLALIGSPSSMMRLAARAPARTLDQRPALLALSSAQAPQIVANLPEGMSGFVAGGYTLDGGSGLTDSGNYDGMRSWNLAMGVEQQLGPNTVLGFSTGVGGGVSGQQRGIDWTRDAMQQLAIYGTQRLGGGLYVAGLMSAMIASGDTGRRVSLGGTAYDLRGSPGTRSYTLATESGVNLPLGGSLTLTPRIGLRYATTHVGGYREDGGDAALLFDKRDYAHAETRLGAKLGGTRAIGGGWSFAPSIQADWVRNLSGGEAAVRARFAAASGYAIDLPGEARARQWGELRGGFQVAKGGVSLGLIADGSTGGALGDNRALGTFAWAF